MGLLSGWAPESFPFYTPLCAAQFTVSFGMTIENANYCNYLFLFIRFAYVSGEMVSLSCHFHVGFVRYMRPLSYGSV